MFDYSKVLPLYEQRHRCYHDTRHVMSMLRELNRILHEVALPSAEGREWATAYCQTEAVAGFNDGRLLEAIKYACDDVADAIVIHDAYYDPQAAWPNNEVLSAEIGERAGAGKTACDVALATAHHLGNLVNMGASRNNFRSKLINDIDLMGFALPREIYMHQTELLYDEVAAFTPPDEWLRKRHKFLNDLLKARPEIYYLKPMRDRYEAKAQFNIAEDLNGISKELGVSPYIT